ncbi:Unannotated [Lentimonas sp. CC19]|nr:Unannotated [Lentimonas sp. CC19]CAA7068457.1 Unannotated [Lentimonas sp. CC11]
MEPEKSEKRTTAATIPEFKASIKNVTQTFLSVHRTQATTKIRSLKSHRPPHSVTGQPPSLTA